MTTPYDKMAVTVGSNDVTSKKCVTKNILKPEKKEQFTRKLAMLLNFIDEKYVPFPDHSEPLSDLSSFVFPGNCFTQLHL